MPAIGRLTEGGHLGGEEREHDHADVKPRFGVVARAIALTSFLLTLVEAAAARVRATGRSVGVRSRAAPVHRRWPAAPSASTLRIASGTGICRNAIAITSTRLLSSRTSRSAYFPPRKIP